MKTSIIGTFLLLISPLLWGQSYQPQQRVQIIHHQIIIPEDGSLQEALALSQEWTENVLRKNENFEDINLFLSDPKKDTLDLMVIYKFKSQISRSTNEINQELIQAHWPQEGAFQEFIQQLRRYINPQLNERKIYQELILSE